MTKNVTIVNRENPEADREKFTSSEVISNEVTRSFDCLNPVGLGAVRMPSRKGDTVIFNHFSKELYKTLNQIEPDND